METLEHDTADGPTTLPPRGRIGTMEAPTRLDDEHYLDFVEGLRKFTLTRLHPPAERAGRARVAELESPVDGPSVAHELGSLPEVSIRHRTLRSAQEMIWSGVRRTYESRREELLGLLDAAEHAGPGTLDIPADFRLPPYLVDYHLEPGGYHTDPLSGFIYHYGTKIFWLGANDEDQQKRRYVHTIPTPTDGRVEKVLDLACAVGQSTTGFKERFPDATVHGIDVAAPLLRYAHRRAVDLGIEVNFAQMAAEELRFEDDSMDLVYASILFHEVPLEVGHRIIAEVARVLRPGGVFVIGDLTPVPDPSQAVWMDYLSWWDSKFNNEPYEYYFRQSDFTSELRKHFPDVVVEAQSPVTTLWTCRTAGGQ